MNIWLTPIVTFMTDITRIPILGTKESNRMFTSTHTKTYSIQIRMRPIPTTGTNIRAIVKQIGAAT